ncbi:hypothetical protein L1987_79549 [Smallanthus sonchifolius]|uniref:Uncharacterized protein n=1 Tax=Smallanthus sonchifolius TaxID=185202 RepID=A0ACB8ZFN0_9ASTR|nr:hypothetical protein L1987_79549 [Smallanthus sonchifolius]
MVLYDSGNQIDEEITIIWRNRAYQVWVREVDHTWPPELKEKAALITEVGTGDADPEGMDLEEGEFRPVMEPEVETTGLSAITVSRNQGEGEQLGAEDNHFLHGDSK